MCAREVTRARLRLKATDKKGNRRGDDALDCVSHGLLKGQTDRGRTNRVVNMLTGPEGRGLFSRRRRKTVVTFGMKGMGSSDLLSIPFDTAARRPAIAVVEVG